MQEVSGLMLLWTEYVSVWLSLECLSISVTGQIGPCFNSNHTDPLPSHVLGAKISDQSMSSMHLAERSVEKNQSDFYHSDSSTSGFRIDWKFLMQK